MKLMENNYASHTPSWPIPLPGQQHQVAGLGISLIIHVLAFTSVVLLGSALPKLQPPLVIDFSMEESFEAPSVQKLVNQAAEPEEILPEPEKVVPLEEILPEQIEMVETIEPEEVAPAEPDPTPAMQPLLEEEKVVVQRLTPRRLKKIIAAKKKAPQQPKPAVKPRPEKKIAASTDIKQNQPVLAKAPLSAAGPRPIKPAVQPKGPYIKEHFFYIRDSVHNKIVYPLIARKKGWQGRVLISFTIYRDGSVKDISIIKSSGFRILDKNAVEVIKKVAPFPRPPMVAELTIPVIYKLN
ncbi:MAG: energy transducer TonB [Thermodesulfobacteriota bacterium]